MCNMAMLSTDGATETHKFAHRVVWEGRSHVVRTTIREAAKVC